MHSTGGLDMEIICFGDSITRGYDVPYGQGWVEICDASIEGVHFTNYNIIRSGSNRPNCLCR